MPDSPKTAPKAASSRAAASRQGGARPAGRTTPPRKPGSRAQAIFAILGLLVIFTMIFGLVAIGFRGFGLGSDNTDTSDQDPTSKLVPTYEAKLQQNPNDFNTMLILANILQNRAEYPEAISWYQKAVDLQPTNVDARLAFGQALASYGQLYDAEAQYKKVLEIDANNVEAEYYLGELYRRWNPPRTEEAKMHYARASELQPEGSFGRAARDALNQLNATPTPATPTP